MTAAETKTDPSTPVFATDEMLETGMNAMLAELPHELANASDDARAIARAFMVYTAMVQAAPADLRPPPLQLGKLTVLH